MQDSVLRINQGIKKAATTYHRRSRLWDNENY